MSVVSFAHGGRRNKELGAKVRETLYQIPLAAIKERPLSPEAVCAFLRNSLHEGEGPDDLAKRLEDDLENQRDLLLAIASISFKILQETLKNFTLFEEGVGEMLPAYLRRVYLLALEQTSIVRMVEEYERNDGGIVDKLFQISTPATWSGIAGRNCLIWTTSKMP